LKLREFQASNVLTLTQDEFEPWPHRLVVQTNNSGDDGVSPTAGEDIHSLQIRSRMAAAALSAQHVFTIATSQQKQCMPPGIGCDELLALFCTYISIGFHSVILDKSALQWLTSCQLPLVPYYCGRKLSHPPDYKFWSLRGWIRSEWWRGRSFVI
jgi:hypothetical protein